jgi:hypothetical protein
MFTNYNFTNSEENKPWKSAYEIQIEALKHEEWRIQNLQEEDDCSKSRAQASENREEGFMSFITKPLQMFFALLG